jgi:putative DNA primase/helicase
MSDAIEQFCDAILAAGIEPPKNIVADGKIHRFPTNDTQKDDAGWYVLHLDGFPAGAFGDWRNNINETWCAASETSMTAEQRAELQQFYGKARRARNAEQQRIWNEAADKAKRLWAAAVEAMDDFPYLVQKGVKSYGLKYDSDCLLVPVRDKGRRLRSLQFINANGKKLFWKAPKPVAAISSSAARPRSCCILWKDMPPAQPCTRQLASPWPWHSIRATYCP